MKTMWRTMMILLALTIRLHAAADIKANNTTALNQTGSWVDGSVPTIANSDVATWDSTVTAANTVAIGGNLDVLGFKVTNPGGAVVISNTAGATLTLGSSGVDMSGAIQDLTLNPSLNIAAHQNWTVNGGRTLRGIAGTNVSSGSGTGNINMIQSGTGTALIIFNQNGNVGGGQTGWSNYSGNITVNTNVKVQSQGNNFVSFGSGTLTLAGGEIAQNSGNWTWSNTIDVSAASVIASDSGDSNPNGRSLKLISDLTSSNSSGLTFTMRNNTLPLRLNDANGFILAGANASTYGTTTISANTKVRVGGEGTTSLTGTGFNPGTRGSLGTGDVTLSAASSYLQFTWTDAHTVANNITGSGNVQIGGTGTGTIGSTNWNMSGTSTQVVTLSGASNYTGATTVKNGRLNLTGTLTSAITVDNGGSISGTGSTTQSLTLASGGKIALAGGATTTSIIVNGATFSGSNYIAFLDAPVDGTVYDVFTYGAGAVVTPENLTAPYRGTLANDPVNQKYTFTADGVGATRTWNTTTGTWDVATTANWLEGDQLFYGGDQVTFGNIASDSVVTLSGAIIPGSVTVNHAANIYAFTGDAIDGTGALTKSGDGILTLTGANTYSGGTTLNAGTLRIGNNNALGGGTLTINAGVLSSDSATARNLANNMVLGGNVQLGDGTNAGLLVLTGSVDLGGAPRALDSRLAGGQGARFDGVISNGALELNGAINGILTLNGNNSYTGATTVTSGRMAIGNNALASSESVSLAADTWLFIGVNGTTLINNLSGASTAYIRTDFTITGTAAARTIAINQTTDGEYAGLFFESATRPISLVKTGAAQLSLSGTVVYTGSTTVEAGTLNLSGGSLACSGVTVNTGSTLAVSGGTLNSATTVQDGGSMSVTGGSVDSAVTVNTGATMDVTGGSVAGSVGVNTGATLDVTGGTIAGSVGVETGGAMDVGGGSLAGAVTIKSGATLTVTVRRARIRAW